MISVFFPLPFPNLTIGVPFFAASITLVVIVDFGRFFFITLFFVTSPPVPQSSNVTVTADVACIPTKKIDITINTNNILLDLVLFLIFLS